MRILRWAAGDEAATQSVVAVTQAAQRADDPLGPPMSARMLRVFLEHGTDPAEVWLASGEAPGSVAGCYHLGLPDMENHDRAHLSLTVHPEFRRRGLGRALLRHAAGRAAQRGRSVLWGGAQLGTPGEAFARQAGARPTLLEARRVLHLEKIPPGHVAALRAEAARAAAGYTLVSWTGATPGEYLEGLATVFNALGDAPHGADHEPQVWDAHRVRERLDRFVELLGHRRYLLAALHSRTGEMAAVTEIGVSPESPEWGHQQITAVTRPHRGHRLGMLVKTAMLDWLLAAEPALARIVTGNAASNRYMIDINERLGFELLEPQAQVYDLPVAEAGGAA